MNFHDWSDKLEYLKYFDFFLKTDAAEAEILTGLTDRREAAKQLYAWGAKEILISHNSEMLVYDGKDFFTCPVKARNLSGRTGRGDTTFGAYLAKRMMGVSIPDALLFATAAVSLKWKPPVRCRGSRTGCPRLYQGILRLSPSGTTSAPETHLIFFAPSAVILVFPGKYGIIFLLNLLWEGSGIYATALPSKDIARIAGVSTSTVSRALSNSPELSEQTRQRIGNLPTGGLPCQCTRTQSDLQQNQRHRPDRSRGDQSFSMPNFSRHRNARTQPRLQRDPVQWAE